MLTFRITYWKRACIKRDAGVLAYASNSFAILICVADSSERLKWRKFSSVRHGRLKCPQSCCASLVALFLSFCVTSCPALLPVPALVIHVCVHYCACLRAWRCVCVSGGSCACLMVSCACLNDSCLVVRVRVGWMIFIFRLFKSIFVLLIEFHCIFSISYKILPC